MTDNPSPQARAVEVTQADRELFISLWEPTDELAEDVRNGRAFTGEVEEIARHRAQAEADALERAALVEPVAEQPKMQVLLPPAAVDSADAEFMDGWVAGQQYLILNYGTDAEFDGSVTAATAIERLQAQLAESEAKHLSAAQAGMRLGKAYDDLSSQLAQAEAGKAEMMKALEPFAKCCEDWIAGYEDDEDGAKFRLLIKDYRRAFATLTKHRKAST